MNDRISKCISCDSINLKYYAENQTLKLPIYICQDCQLHTIGTSQKQLESILENFYEEEFWDEQRDYGLVDSHTDAYSIGRKRLFTSQFQYIQKFLKKDFNILEIGSGHGETLIEFEKLNFKITGIEPDLKNVTHLKKILRNSKVIQSNIEDFNIDEKFDLIWMSHVFEHLPDPILFLENIQKNMKPESILFIEVPSVTKKNDYRTFTIVPHAYNYSGNSLQNLLQKTGYKIISHDYFGPPTKVNGLVNKIHKSLFKKNFYPFYPKIRLNSETGEDMRFLVKIK